MVALRRIVPSTDSRRLELAEITVTNAVPVVGVVAFEWNVAALLVLYWFELAVDAVWAFVRALFAARPPEIDTDGLLIGAVAQRRPTLAVPWTDLRIHVVTLLTLPIAVLVVGGVWLFAGAFLVGPLGASALDDDTIASVTLATLAILCTTGVSTIRTYFLRGEYRNHNAQTAISGVVFRILTVFFVAMFTLTMVGLVTAGPDTTLASLDPTAVGPALLIAIIGLKFASDFLGVYSDRLAVYFVSYDEAYGWSQAPPEPQSVASVPADAADRVRPTLAGRVLGGALRLPQHPGVAFLGVFLLAVAALFAFGSAWLVVGLLVALAVAVPLTLVSIDHLLRYGAVEYRAAQDERALVAYDRLFGVSLWRVEPWDETAVRIERTLLDRLLGTETVVVELPDDEYLLPHLPATTPILSVFDREPDRPQS